MNKVFIIIFILLNLVAQSYSGEIEKLKEDVTVNKLIQNGWKIYSTNSISYKDTDTSQKIILFYHLKKDQQLVTCSVDRRGRVNCLKP